MEHGKVLMHEDAKRLLQLCRAGKLYEIEEWLQSGKSICVPPEFKKPPLQTAVEIGFHSLVRLLARNEKSQQVKNAALHEAVKLRRYELAELLLQLGSEVNGVPFCDVLLSWEPRLIRLFLDNGADVISGAPFAEAFGAKVRTALRPFMQYREAHPELSAQLQEQLDRALRYFAYKGDLKWVSLLMWTGANPRSVGPKLYEDDDPESYCSAMQEACYGRHLDTLKRLKPDPTHDNLSDLLDCAALGAPKEVLGYLLDLGANPNMKPNGGSAAFDSCMWHIHFDSFSPWPSTRGSTSRYQVQRSLDAMEELAKHGAIWKPNDRRQMDSIRRVLYECKPEVTIEVLKLLVSYKACTDETMKDFVATPRMRQLLAGESWWVSRLRLRPIVEAGLTASGKRRKNEIPAVSSWLISTYKREELYEKVWTQPMQKLSKEYGISDVGLAKVCKKLFIPLPGRGYWAKKAAGKSVPKRPTLKPVVIR